MKIKAKYDQLISTPIKDNNGEIIDRKEYHHFTLGYLGDSISGGFYIKKGIEIPSNLEIEIPDIVRKEDK
jgi:hypothetical protein